VCVCVCVCVCVFWSTCLYIRIYTYDINIYALAGPLAACRHGWHVQGLGVGEVGRGELRQAALKALLAAGSAAGLAAFVARPENRDLMSAAFVGALVSRGLFDAALDVMLALAPETPAARCRSWLTAQQVCG
jgi:hypothetical protein